MSACAVCDGFFYRNQEVVIVGAGDSACEEASYLAKLCTKVTMLVRRDEMRASKAMQHRVKNMENIEILFNTETVEVLGAEAVEGVKVRNNVSGEETPSLPPGSLWPSVTSPTRMCSRTSSPSTTKGTL